MTKNRSFNSNNKFRDIEKREGGKEGKMGGKRRNVRPLFLKHATSQKLLVHPQKLLPPIHYSQIQFAIYDPAK
jgi:hypothetical protein